MLHHLIIVYLFLITICLSAAEPVDPNQIRTSVQTINHSSLQDFENLRFKPSIETEIRNHILISNIQALALTRLEYVRCQQIETIENNVANKKTKYINAQKMNFKEGWKEVDGYLANSLILINLRADDGAGNPKIISYFAPLETFLDCNIFSDYLDKLAILNPWDTYSHFTVSIKRAGEYMRGIVGLTESQDGEKFRKKMKEEAGEDRLSLYIPRKGGAPQLFITYAEHNEHYDLGPISNPTNYDFFVDKDGNQKQNVQEKDYRPLFGIQLKDVFSSFFNVCQRVIISDAYQYPYRYLYDRYNNVLHSYKKMNNQIHVKYGGYKPYQLNKYSSLILCKPQPKDMVPYKPNLSHQIIKKIATVSKYVRK